MSKSVQFKGVESVLDAFESRKVPAWGLFQDRTFLFKYEGENMEEATDFLSGILEKLSRSSNAIYTLKVYEDLNGQKIKEKTESDGSFNFRLNDENQEITNSQYARMGSLNGIAERLEAIESRLTDKEGEEKPHKLGLLGEILQDENLGPVVANAMGSILQSILPALMPKAKPAHQPTTTNPNFAEIRPAGIAGIAEDELQINKAISILRKADDRLPEHLLKLAAISQKDPATFQILLSTLDSFK